MSKDYGGYFFTTKTGVRVFVPTTKEESKSLAHDLNKNARRSKTGKLRCAQSLQAGLIPPSSLQEA